MEVIGTGFGRTGTLSTKLALEQLGFGPCHHMLEAFRHPDQFRTLAAYLDGEPVNWHQLFAPYRSQVDFPGAALWPELVEAFPQARVLHTVRDPERWYESTLTTIYQFRTMFAPWIRRGVPVVDRILRVIDGLVWDGIFDGQFEDRDRAIEIFESHTDAVRAAVPADQLLVFNVSDGWEPLCEFLGVPAPDGPFPHVNDRRAMLARIRAVRTVGRSGPWIAGVGVMALAGRLTRDRRS